MVPARGGVDPEIFGPSKHIGGVRFGAPAMAKRLGSTPPPRAPIIRPQNLRAWQSPISLAGLDRAHQVFG